MILMSGYSIGFGEEIKKSCQKMWSVRMLIWSAEMKKHSDIWTPEFISTYHSSCIKKQNKIYNFM